MYVCTSSHARTVSAQTSPLWQPLPDFQSKVALTATPSSTAPSSISVEHFSLPEIMLHVNLQSCRLSVSPTP